MSKQILKFPPGFLWGVSTSAYQIEGGNVNDWSEWEEKNADRLAKQAKIFWQPWQQKKFPEMFNRDNYICGQACDSYHRWQEDLDLVESLNCNAYRFSLEWSRLEPEPGQWQNKEIEHYRKILLAMKQRNLKTVVTLWHWTNPVWLAKLGGWSNKKAINYFCQYTKKVADELGELIDYWVILNEPMVHLTHGYITKKFPPNKKNYWQAIKVYYHLVEAQKSSYQIIHQRYTKAQVGLASLINYFEPAKKWCPVEIGMARLANYFWNQKFLNDVKNYFDYIGVDYYFHNRMVWHPPFKKNLNEKVTDRGWEIYPAGIYIVFKNYKKYKKPIYILENGIADADDKLRPDFIRDHLYYVHQAIAEGVDVRGYFYWSLLDNFEWAEGFKERFGLVYVDYPTQKRIPKDSAYWYRQVIATNGASLSL